MLTKFESKSNRVKGLCFHRSRPWILTSLHNGVIQLWDYRMGTLLDRFDEHDGPVRGVDFHHTQPLFVSGGDDYKIKVWDYKMRRCLFTLLGHLDYIRTVQFHHEYPWIVSSSDDQTIRIWNWQSRSCVSVLTGHNHYVMCAAFHPKEDLVVSASLDQTVRIWDTTGLRKKTVRGAPPTMEDNMSSRVNNDLFGGTDAAVKYVLEGHDRGVNYAGFHPNLPLIVSGADDRQVKLWRMNETKAWEVDTMRGHTNNVSCVLFHPRHELMISNSEDRSIRVWDISKRMGVQTFRRENDRFWILAAHPTQNLLAAGHDSGMIVFKLERERPAMESIGGKIYYVKERYIRMHDFDTQRDVPVASLRRTGTIGTGLGNLPKTLNYNSYNPSESNVIICSDADGGTYELFTFEKNGSGQADSSDASRGSGLAAVFVARNRFAVLDKSKQHIFLKNFQNEVTKKLNPPNGSADHIYFAGTVGRVLIRSEDKMILYETQSRRVLNEIIAPRVKYVIWSENFNYVALVSKHVIIIANRQFEQLSTIHETIRIKSGIWDFDGQGIFVYTTLNHIKYCLFNGDHGIIRTLDVPIYLTGVFPNHLPSENSSNNTNLHCLDREGKTRVLAIDLTECQFKLALHQKRYQQVMQMVKHSRLCGRGIITFLTEKGYPEIALHFVNDEKTRFNLALSCGNLDVAMSSALELDQNECWHQLGIEALRQGNLHIVEMAYQQNKDFERLSFLYLLTGDREKLKKMMKIAEMRNDVMARFHNSLYLGDVSERIKVLESAGQLALAYLTASHHGVTEEAERIRGVIEELEGIVPEIDSVGALMMPPVPIFPPDSDQWPLAQVHAEKTLDQMMQEAPDEPISMSHPAQSSHDPDFDDDIRATSRKVSVDFADMNGDEWDEDLDLGMEDDELDQLTTGGASGAPGGGESINDFIAAPTAGTSPNLYWQNNSSLAADNVAAGAFENAMQLLNRQIGVVNFTPLKPLFMAIYTSSTAYLGTTNNASLVTYLQRSGIGTKSTLPSISLTLASLSGSLRTGYRAFTGAKFDEVKEVFQTIIQSIPLLAVSTREEVVQVKELLTICQGYLLACRIRGETSNTPLDQNPKRHVELSSYLTHCGLQPSHLLLTLKIAMTSAFKTNNFILAASFCRRLLELPEINHERQAKLKMTAKKVLQKSEKEARNELDVDYSDTNGFHLCGESLVPLYRDKPSVQCPYCGTYYQPQYKGQLCCICQLSQIGEETLGLVVSTT